MESGLGSTPQPTDSKEGSVAYLQRSFLIRHPKKPLKGGDPSIISKPSWQCAAENKTSLTSSLDREGATVVEEEAQSRRPQDWDFTKIVLSYDLRLSAWVVDCLDAAIEAPFWLENHTERPLFFKETFRDKLVKNTTRRWSNLQARMGFKENVAHLPQTEGAARRRGVFMNDKRGCDTTWRSEDHQEARVLGHGTSTKKENFLEEKKLFAGDARA